MKSICSIEGCDRSATRRGWCSKHYERWRAHGDPNVVIVKQKHYCSIEGCVDPVEAHGYCSKHYQRWQTHGDPEYVAPKLKCQIDGCDRKHSTQGYCSSHWYRLNKYGDPLWERIYKHEMQAAKASTPSPKIGLDFRIEVPWELTPELAEAFQSLPKRVRDKIDYGEGCWEWNACRDTHGYGRASKGKEGGHRVIGAYRLVYELVVEDPGANVVDHLCRNPACVRPDHLESVPNGENIRRGRSSNHSGYCRSGRHEWIKENILQEGGYQRCEPCRTEWETARAENERDRSIAA